METTASSMQPGSEDFARIRLWAGFFFARPENLPFSFVYAGQEIRGIPAAWKPVQRSRRLDANLVETVYEATDPTGALKIRVECLRYQDYPVMEWVVWLTNNSKMPTLMIENILGMDGVFEGTAPAVHHCNGDYYSADGYTPFVTPLETGQTLRFAPDGGRPCDQAFPYFRLQFEGGGLNLAVGWPGQWSAVFEGSDKGVQVTAGQGKTHLRLLPGETIRTPRMTLQAWAGDLTRGINLWRRWYLAHILPKPDGHPLRSRLACAATEDGEEFTNASEENQLRLMGKCQQAGINFDVWWIDAGWYPCRDENGDKKWWRVGTWEPDPDRFPQGFSQVSKKAEQYGADLLVWFEPERVYTGSRLHREHPEWLLRKHSQPGSESDTNRLLDLGNPDCRVWLTEHICRLIAENGIKIYRQDFNFPPLDYWRDNDDVDRQGIHENLHVQGYLRFWDELLTRNPGLWIDSCSSGGRRNDLETMRRSVPLHYTDYGYGNHAVKLAFHHTLYAWIPYFKECTLSWDICEPGDEMRFNKQSDSFSFHCGMAAMLFATLDIRRDDYDFETAQRMIAVWRKAAETLLHGDYYPLTPFSKLEDQWVVWQFDQPESRTGLVQGIRLAECPEASKTVFLQSISTDQRYMFENPETQETIEIAGSDLMRDGFTFRLPRRSAAIWFFGIQSS